MTGPRRSKEQAVWEACEALTKQGARITYRNIAEKLVELGYNRGSNSDICRYLLTWKQKRYNTPPNALDHHVNDMGITLKKALSQIQEQCLVYADQTLLLLERERSRLKETEHQNASETKKTPSLDQKLHGNQYSYLKLLQQHQEQFDHYMHALEQLRQANKILNQKITSLRASYQVALEEKDKVIKQYKEALTAERHKRMVLEKKRTASRVFNTE